MIQVTPEVIRQMMNSSAAMSPSSVPRPDRTTVPSPATPPPYTVKTRWMASTKPPKLVTWVTGRTIRMPATGIA